MLTNLTKPAWQSKTLWFDAIALVATFVLDHAGLLPTLGLKPQTITEIVAVANIALRLVTYTGISLTGKP